MKNFERFSLHEVSETELTAIHGGGFPYDLGFGLRMLGLFGARGVGAAVNTLVMDYHPAR